MAKTSRTDWILVAAIIVAVAVFGAGYRFGIRSEDSSSESQARSLRAEETSWKEKIKACYEEQAQFVTKDGAAKERINSLEAKIKTQEAGNDELYRRNTQLDAESSICAGELQAQFAQWQEADEKMAQKIRDISELNQDLRVKIKRLTGTRSQDQMLVEMGLNRVREENFKIRATLGQEPPTDLRQFETSVLEKWKDKIDAKTLNQVREISTTENSTLQASDRVFKYNATEHTEFFFPTVKEDGTLSRPMYFDREGTSEVTKGVILSPRRRRIHSVAFLVKSLYNYGLCAYRNNNPNFTYPDSFYVKPNASRTHASEIVDTPLLRFCVDCKRWANTTAFRLACLGDTVEYQYGTRDFWAVRSMIRYHSPYYFAAEDALVAKGLIPDPGTGQKKVGTNPLSRGPYIGAIYRGENNITRRCKDGKGFMRHVKWLTQTYPKQNFFLGGRKQPLCYPSIDLWCSSVKDLVQAQNVSKVYISTSKKSEPQLKQCNFGSGVEIFTATPRQRDPEDQVLDHIMLSKARYLVGDGYSDLSQVVTEAWILSRRFNPEGLYLI